MSPKGLTFVNVPRIALTLVFGVCLSVQHVNAQGVRWKQQVGTSAEDYIQAVSADALGGVYITGYTAGSLGGSHMGGYDAFLTKFRTDGVLEWSKQIATTSQDWGYGVSADGTGNVYVSGGTHGNLGSSNYGNGDAFLTKCNAEGAIEWTRQLGTNRSDSSYGVSADHSGNVFISGYTSGTLVGPNTNFSPDAFVSKYDNSGVLQWSRQLGSTTSSEESFGVSADGMGGVYIAGRTNGSLGGPNLGSLGYDAFLSRYASDGTLLWTQQFGTNLGDEAHGVASDHLGNVYVSGFAGAGLGPADLEGQNYPFLAKYDAAGMHQWTQKVPTALGGVGNAVSVDGLGNVYISGGIATHEPEREGAATFYWGPDAFVSKYDSSGSPQWMRTFGRNNETYLTSADTSYGVAADNLGNVFLAGITEGSLAGPFLGVLDGFVTSVVADALTPEEVLRDSVRFEYSGGQMKAIFTPNHGLTLAEAAEICGVDGFNWVQTFEEVGSGAKVWRQSFPRGEIPFLNVTPDGDVYRDSGTEIVPAEFVDGPTIDPVIDGATSSYVISYPKEEGFGFQPAFTFWADNLPYVYNLTSGHGYGSLASHINPSGTSLEFLDLPSTATEIFEAGGYTSFFTQLVGMKDGEPASWSGLGTNFSWKSNRVHEVRGSGLPGGGVFDVFYRLTDPAVVPPSAGGGIFDVATDSVTVPEPSAVVLLFLSFALSASHRRRRSQIAA